MQFTTIGFNQKMAVDNDLDQSDLHILSWIMTFSLSSKMVTYNKDGKTFLWVQYQAIIDDLPIMKIKSKRVIAERLHILVEKGFLDKEIQKNKGNYTYFAILDKTINMKFNKEPLCTQNYIPYAPKTTYPMHPKLHTKDSNTNNSNTNKKEKSDLVAPKEKLSFDYSSFENDEVVVIDKWLEYKKSIKQPLKAKASYTALRNQLLELKANGTLIKSVEVSIDQKWKGIWEQKEQKHFINKQNTQANSNIHETFKNVERTGPIVVTDW